MAHIVAFSVKVPVVVEVSTRLVSVQLTLLEAIVVFGINLSSVIIKTVILCVGVSTFGDLPPLVLLSQFTSESLLVDLPTS